MFRLDAVPGLGGWVEPTLHEHAATQRRVVSLKRAILVDHLLDCVDGNPAVLSGEHARHALEIMLKANESARAGRALELTTTFPHPAAGEAVPVAAEAAGL